MALKNFNPTSPGRRFMTHLTYDELTKSTPEKSLTEPLKKTCLLYTSDAADE